MPANRSLLALLFVLTLAACDSAPRVYFESTAENDCQSSHDCPSSWSCINARCTPGLTPDGDYAPEWPETERDSTLPPDGDPPENEQEPENAPQAPYPILSIAAGSEHSCALLQNGDVYCWGLNDSYQLGHPSAECVMTDGRPGPPCSATPAKVLELPDSVREISAGGKHTCVLTISGEVYCFGNNVMGQLGEGTVLAYNKPTRVKLAHQALTISAGETHTCAIGDDGRLYCWGRNDKGQIGTPDIQETCMDEGYRPWPCSTFPVKMAPFSGSLLEMTILRVAAGYDHTCVATAARSVACFGGNAYGQSGDNAFTDTKTPLIATPKKWNQEIQALSTGGYHTCVTFAASSVSAGRNGVFCWGSRHYSSMDPTTCYSGQFSPCDPWPALIFGASASDLAAGFDFGCALRTGDGQVVCWGGPYAPGCYSYDCSDKVVVIDEAPAGMRQLAAGKSHACALNQSGDLYCWFSGAPLRNVGQLGNGLLDSGSGKPQKVRW